MHLTEVKERMLATLRHGALNEDEIAAELDEALFHIKAELKALRRERLVRDRLDPRGHLWELTDHGYAVLAGREAAGAPRSPARGGVGR